MIRLGLDSTIRLCAELNDPQNELDFIHIAGTNGKGSVSAVISSVLRESGLKVGSYNSPAVFSETEIIRINNRNITKKKYDELHLMIEGVCDKIEKEGNARPTEFEIQTALAFKYFKDNSCDIVVLECGMGGEGDATNVIRDPLECIFTSVSMDHTEYLGNSLHKIAYTKAGIIKEGALVFTSNTDPEVVDAIKEKAKDFDISVKITIPDTALLKKTSFRASYQAENVSLAVCALKALNGRKLKSGKEITIDDKVIDTGLHNVSWPGRFELISQRPDIIIDGAHNPGAAKALKLSLDQKYKGKKQFVFVVGMLADKDHENVLSILLKDAYQVLTVSTTGLRGFDAVSLAGVASLYNPLVTSVGGVHEAMELATMLAGKDKVIVVCGTLSLLDEVKKWCKTLRGK
ncbi:MAG: bifunctional folylpolyglutamate synthase/dihydrofolate synthase [Lachnospiraceae bacterium]|nr:bifunctional folylpolyglutamate synthase/dihydrofolate synthase [Lachnospiraceae bacterium]